MPSINSGVLFGVVLGSIAGACCASAALYVCCIRGTVPRSPLLAASSPHGRDGEKRDMRDMRDMGT